MIGQEEGRRLLEQRRTDLMEMDRPSADARTGDVSGDRDQLEADMGTETFEREKDGSLDATVEVHLDRIQEAMGRLEEGTWGKCVVCGQSIGDERLRARPETRYCIDHAPA